MTNYLIQGGLGLPQNFYTNATGPTGPSQLIVGVVGPLNQTFQAELNVVGGTGGSRIGMLVPSGAICFVQGYGVSTGANGQSAQSTVTGSAGLAFVPGQWCMGTATGPVSLAGYLQAATGVTGVAQVVIGNMGATGLTGSIGTGSWLMSFQST